MTTPDYLQTELYALASADTLIFDFLQGTVLDGLWYWDLTAPANAWVNDRLWHTLGHAAAPLAQPGAWRTVLHPKDLAEVEQLAQAGRHDPAQRSFERLLRCTHADGSTVWLQCCALLLPDASGTPTRLLGALLNITREKQKEVYSQEVARHYSSILSNQSVYIIKTDAHGNYTYVNDLFYERFGEDSKLLGTNSLESIVPEDRDKCLAVVMQCFTEPEVPHQVVLRKPYKDGSTKSNHWEFKGLANAQGQVTEILCVGYDVTLLTENLKRAQLLLEVTKQQNQRLQNFAYIISHNIRSHSANLSSLVKLLTTPGYESQAPLFMQMLKTSTDKLAETIANLSEIVTINTGNVLPREARMLRAEVTKTLDSLKVQLREHDVIVRNDIPVETLVYAVPAYLDSILLNLLSNAIKYRAPDRPAVVRLYAYDEPGYTVLAVEDNGLGIDLAKHRAKLFGMYKTFHDNADARGLGLFIIKNQIEAMEGKIDADSEAGVGSTFKVYFNERP